MDIDWLKVGAEVKDNVQPSIQDFQQFTVEILKQLEENTAEESSLAIFGQCLSFLENLTKAMESCHIENDKHQENDMTAEGLAYNQLGLAEGRLGNFKRAIEYHEQDLKLAKEVGDRAAEEGAYRNLGNAYHNLGDFKTAIDCHSRSLEIAKELEDRSAEGSAYGNLGNAYHGLGDFKTALNYHKKHLKTATEVGDTSGEKMSYVNLGIDHYSLGDYETAIKYHERALKLCKEMGDRIGEGREFGNLGNVFHRLGDFKTAVDYHTRNLLIAQEMRDRTGEEAAYGNLGLAHERLGEYQAALHYHQCCLEIAKEVGNRYGEECAYGNIGIVYHRLGDFKTAIEYYERDLKMAQQVGNRVGESRSYGNLGNAYNSLGEFKTAIDYHKRNLNIAKETGDIAGEGMACGNLGNALQNLGDFKQAMDYITRSLKIAKEVRDKAGIGIAYSNLGNAHFSLGDFKTAEDYHKRSLKVAKAVGDKGGEERAYCNLGNTHFRMENFETAMRYFERDLNMTKEMKNRDGEGLAYCNLGNAYCILGDAKKAIDYYERSLEIAKQIGDMPGEGKAYGNLGFAYHILEDFERALDCHERCLKVVQELGDDVGAARAFYNLGCCFESQGTLEEAVNFYKRSVTTFNSIRESLQFDEWKISLRNMYRDVYARLWRLLLKQGKVVEALFSAEQGRAQALNDLMEAKYSFQTTNAGPSETVKGIHGMLSRLPSTTVFIAMDKLEIIFWICRKEKEIQLRKRLISDNGSQDDVTSFFQSLMQITWQEIGVRSGVKCEDRSWIKQTVEKPVNERSRQKRLNSSHHGEKMVMKDAMEGLADENNHSGHGSRHGFTTFFHSLMKTVCHKRGVQAGVKYNARNKKLPQTRSGQERFHYSQLGTNALQTLHDVIVGPIVDLAQDNEIVFVPEGPLCLAPYAAFMDSNLKYLCESFRIRVIPSLTCLTLMADCPKDYHSQTGALLVGDPWVQEVTNLQQLSFAREEVQMIGRILHTAPLIGKQATKNEVLKRLSSVALVHIAAHGRMETGEIALAPNVTQPSRNPGEEDFILTMNDVLGVQMRAKLVVLSCCHSAHGEINAEGVVGIARAFLGAGARSVLVSLWAIDDEATLEFMKHFYQHLVKGTTASEALNQSMKCMRQSEMFSAVRYWAPFVIIGDDVTVEFERRK